MLRINDILLSIKQCLFRCKTDSFFFDLTFHIHFFSTVPVSQQFGKVNVLITNKCLYLFIWLKHKPYALESFIVLKHNNIPDYEPRSEFNQTLDHFF